MKSHNSIYVIGPPRSGSTLTYNILCSALNTNDALNETHVLPELAKQYHHTVGRLNIEQGHIFSNEGEVRDLYINYSHTFVQRLKDRYPGTDILVIKSIVAANVAPLLTLLNPDQLYCVCVRDPRDIVVSMIRVGEKQEKKGMRNQYPRNMVQLANRIAASYMHCLINPSVDFKRNSFVVEYRQLIEDTENAIKIIETNTNLDLGGFDPAGDWKKSKVDIEKRKGEGAPFLTEHWGKPITANSLGAYKNILSSKEISKVENICKPIFEMFEF